MREKLTEEYGDPVQESETLIVWTKDEMTVNMDKDIYITIVYGISDATEILDSYLQS